ncbi:MAG TPA: hypothetical protein VFA99_06435 [Acidobacteriaceae bacterium]|nr:hypothetical protein [Acidobacteriaceae bacterium]
MRTTLTIDDDLAALLERENRRAAEPWKQTVNRVLRCGVDHLNHPAKRKRFTVKPLDTGITAEQWAAWEGRKLEDILDEAEREEKLDRSRR